MIKEIENIIDLISPMTIYSFGSNQSNQNLNKDFDLLIISDYFEGISRQYRKNIITNILRNADPICLTQEELKTQSKKTGIYQKIINEGTLLYGSKID